MINQPAHNPKRLHTVSVCIAGVSVLAASDAAISLGVQVETVMTVGTLLVGVVVACILSFAECVTQASDSVADSGKSSRPWWSGTSGWLRLAVFVTGLGSATYVACSHSLHGISALLYERSHPGVRYFLTERTWWDGPALLVVGLLVSLEIAGAVIPWQSWRSPCSAHGRRCPVRKMVRAVLLGIAVISVTAIYVVAESSDTGNGRLDPEFHARLSIFERALRKRGIEAKMISGRRSYEGQDHLYAQGRSSPGRTVTNARGGYSWHNFGLAADYVLLANGKANWEGPWDVFGETARSCGLEWGGDCSGLADRPHVQWTKGRSLWQLRALDALHDVRAVSGAVLAMMLSYRALAVLLPAVRKHPPGSNRVTPRQDLPLAAGTVLRTALRYAMAGSVIFLLLLVGSYTRFTGDGLDINGFWSIGETHYGWDDIAEIGRIELVRSGVKAPALHRYQLRFTDGAVLLSTIAAPQELSLDQAFQYVALHSGRRIDPIGVPNPEVR